MRILFAFAGGGGHLEPLVPIAQAAEAAGHVVAFTGRPWMVPRVEALGFPAFATGSDLGGAPKRLPLRALDAEREDRALREGFASYRDPAFPLPATAHTIRPLALDPARNDSAPAWITRLNGAPTVYFTLGTVFNHESGDLFARVLAGLRDLPINVIATVGREIDPEELGPQGANIQIERYIPRH